MLDHVSTVSTAVSALKEVDRRIIRNAVWRASLSCLGSAVQLEIRRADAGDEDTEESMAAARAVDPSAYEARVVAAQWIISDAGVPDDVVKEEAAGALKWLATRKDNDQANADLDDLREIGLDAETIEAGRKLAARWTQARSQERSKIVLSIGDSVVRDITSGVDQHDWSRGSWPSWSTSSASRCTRR